MPGEMSAYARPDHDRPVPLREPAIPSQVSRLVQQSELIRRHLEELQTRLAPLLGPDVPMNMVGSDGLKRQQGCEMADKLGLVVEMIDGGNAVLANILKRLEI